MTQAHIIYSGMVQGIGFRYTVHHFVTQIGDLGGWVKNLPDGRVELLVEGSQQKVEKLLLHIESHFEANIRDKDVNIKPTEGQFKDFQVAF